MAYYGPADFEGRALTNTIARLTWVNNSVYSEIELYCYEAGDYAHLYSMESQYDWAELTAGELYHFSLRAKYQSSGEWTEPLYCSVEMVGGTADPPSDFALTKFHTYAELTWFSFRLDATSIEVHRSDADHNYSGSPLASLPPNIEFYRDASPLSHCWYKIRYSFSEENYSDWSSEVEYTAPSAPADVTNFQAEGIWSNSILLGWTEPTTGDLPAKYDIYLKVGATWKLKASLPYSWNHLLYDQAEPETIYDFKIVSVGPGGSSAGVELEVETISQPEGIVKEKKIGEERQFRLTIGEPAEVVVFSGESGSENGYPFQLIETDEIALKLGGEMFSDNIQMGGGRVVVAAIIGEDETALEETFLGFDLIGQKVTIDIIFGDDIYRVGNGFISSIELKDHKITISYDDALAAKVGIIMPEKIGENIIPEIWGWADVKLIETESIKKKWKACSHRIKNIDAIWKNETILSPSDYYINYSTGEVSFKPDFTMGENDILVARVSGRVNEMDFLRNNPADILSDYFGEYFDKKLSSQVFRNEGGLTIYPMDISIDDEIPASEMVGRTSRQLGLLSFEGPDGLVVVKANADRATDIYIQPDVEVIKPAERVVSQDNLCSKIIIHYGQSVSIPDENRYEQTYGPVGKEKEYDIWGTLNSAYQLANDIFPDWDGKERWSFSLPYILWNLWPGKVVEFETGEKIMIETIEFQFSKNQTIIGGIKL